MESTPRRKRGWLRILWWLLYAVVVYGIASYVVNHWDTIRQVEFQGRWYHLAAGFGMVLLSVAIGIGTLRYFLAQFGVSVTWRAAFRIYSVPQVGKYLPGRVGSLPASMWMIKREGLPASHALSITAVFTALTTQSGLFVGLLLLPSVLSQFNPAFRWLIAGAAIAGLAFCCTPLVWRILNRLLKLVGRPAIDRHPSTGAMAVLLLWLMCRWLVIGLGYALMARFIRPVTLADLPLLTAVFPLAYYVGFLAILAPAGIGVQEGMLIVLLDPSFGPGFAAMFAGLSRMMLVGVDLILITAAMIIKHHSPAAAPEPAALPEESP